MKELIWKTENLNMPLILLMKWWNGRVEKWRHLIFFFPGWYKLLSLDEPQIRAQSHMSKKIIWKPEIIFEVANHHLCYSVDFKERKMGIVRENYHDENLNMVKAQRLMELYSSQIETSLKIYLERKSY